MKLVTDKMYQQTDNQNRMSLVSILPNFFLDDESIDLCTDRILYNKYNSVGNLKLDSQQRCMIKLELNEANDITYYTYKNLMNHYRKEVVFGGVNNHEIRHNFNELMKYETYTSGKVKIDGQQCKLFKWLLKIGVDKGDVENITTKKNSVQDLYICISRNPVDYLFASTNQSYKSCLNLESDYPYYMGLPSTFVDNNRFMVFTTTGKLRKYEIKGNTFKHFRIVNRCWGFVCANTGNILLEKTYPNSDHEFYLSPFGLYEAYYMSEMTFKNSRFCTDIENNNMHIYLDSVGIDWQNNDYVYVQGGKTGHFTHYNYRDGFESLTDYDQLGDGNVCAHCSEIIDNHEDDTFYSGGEPYCDYCRDDIFFYCECCNSDQFRSEMVDVGHIYICESCADADYTRCYQCGVHVYNDDILADSENNCYCESCFSENAVECVECGDILHTDNITYCSNNNSYCDSCATNVLIECSECGDMYNKENEECCDSEEEQEEIVEQTKPAPEIALLVPYNHCRIYPIKFNLEWRV